MQLGAMNNPAKDVYEEVSWIAERFDFVDLTLEPPGADAAQISVEKLRAALNGKKVIGHTAWYLPFANPYASVRKSALGELLKCLGVFRQIDCKLMNVHIGAVHRFFRNDAAGWYSALLKEVVSEAEKSGIAIMAEHMNSNPKHIQLVEDILKAVPELKFHLDIGHANLNTDSFSDSLRLLLKKFSKRLAHVHISDNNGKDDLHLPLGTGMMNLNSAVQILRSKYDGTITLEVFSRDRDYLTMSAKKFREMWLDAKAV